MCVRQLVAFLMAKVLNLGSQIVRYQLPEKYLLTSWFKALKTLNSKESKESILTIPIETFSNDVGFHNEISSALNGVGISVDVGII